MRPPRDLPEWLSEAPLTPERWQKCWRADWLVWLSAQIDIRRTALVMSWAVSDLIRRLCLPGWAARVEDSLRHYGLRDRVIKTEELERYLIDQSPIDRLGHNAALDACIMMVMAIRTRDPDHFLYAIESATDAHLHHLVESADPDRIEQLDLLRAEVLQAIADRVMMHFDRSELERALPMLSLSTPVD